MIGISIVAALYTSSGRLRAVAWADLFQGIALRLGGLVVFALGLRASGGWGQLAMAQGARLHMVLPAEHPGLPWTGVLGGIWIVELYDCGLNQFIVQRTLVARLLRDAQLGVIFAGALWLFVPLAIVVPGIIALHLYGPDLARPDDAFPMRIRRLVPFGL